MVMVLRNLLNRSSEGNCQGLESSVHQYQDLPNTECACEILVPGTREGPDSG